MKVCVVNDEWYPVAQVVKEGESAYYARRMKEMPDELIAEYEAAIARFDEVQDRIWKAWEAAT